MYFEVREQGHDLSYVYRCFLPNEIKEVTMQIVLEYVIVQYQTGKVSVAIYSTKPRQQNPALVIVKSGTEFVWRLTGLHMGEIENIKGEQRANRLDFYIGMDDLIEQRSLFPKTRAVPLGLSEGLRIPTGTERIGGKRIRWQGAVSRVQINSVRMIIPPFSLNYNSESELMLNVDKESSPYPIISEGGKRTMRELHIGIEHDYTALKNRILKIPRIDFTMTARQYATILEAIDRAIAQHQVL